MAFDLSGILSNAMGSGAGKVAGTAMLGGGMAAKQGPMGLSALFGLTGGQPLGMGLLGGLLGGSDEDESTEEKLANEAK